MDPENPAAINNHFVCTLQKFREGESINELSEALQVLVQAVRQTQKGGTLTYVVKIKPHGDAVTLTDEIKIKAPENRETKIFFATDDNLLVRDNPDQREIAFREVEKETVPMKDITKQPAANVAS
jgi:predicted metalloprotease